MDDYQKRRRQHMERAGLPEWTSPRCIGARQMEELAHLKESDPEVWAVLVKAHRLSTDEFNARLAVAGMGPIEPSF